MRDLSDRGSHNLHQPTFSIFSIFFLHKVIHNAIVFHGSQLPAQVKSNCKLNSKFTYQIVSQRQLPLWPKIAPTQEAITELVLSPPSRFNSMLELWKRQDALNSLIVKTVDPFQPIRRISKLPIEPAAKEHFIC